MNSSNMALYMAERRRQRRATLIEMAGSKCIKCGSTDKLEFDHRERKDKLLTLSGKGLDGAWLKILIELDKCDLLCRRHHLEKTLAVDERSPAWNKGVTRLGEVIPEHGHEVRYVNGCRCDPCRQARYDAKIRRGETDGSRGRYKFQTMAGTREVAGISLLMRRD